MKRVFRALEYAPWQLVVLSEKTITVARTGERPDLKKPNQYKFDRQSCCYTTNLDVYQRRSFLGYPKQDFKEDDDKMYIDIQPINKISKTLSIVKENDFCYFMVKSNIETCHLNLMNLQQ
jgi:hypothetical protein